MSTPFRISSRGKYLTTLKSEQDEIDSIKLDPSKLSADQQRRAQSLNYISANLAEVDEIEMQLKKKWNFEDEIEETEISVQDTKWSGQAGMQVSKVGQKTWADIVDRPVLAFVDAAALVVFAWIGRANHGDATFDLDVLKTAFPFLSGWFAISPLMGTYTRQATLSQVDSFKVVLAAWALSVPSGIAFRAVLKGEVPPTPFIIVSLVATLVILLSSRALYIQINGNPDAEYRRGGIFDGLRMISTLIQRW